MEQQTDLSEIIEYINPAELDYQEWVNVGMALKHEGYSVSVWDSWSRKDYARYHKNECERKWQTFRGNSSPVTAGTIVQMAMGRGWRPKFEGHELDWNDAIGEKDDLVIIDKNWIEEKEIKEPKSWNPEEQLITKTSHT